MAAAQTDLIYGRSLNTLFRRCVVNCPAKPPPCPECPEGETCSLISQSCQACQKTVCISLGEVGGVAAPDEPASSNIGAIAGGVIGGLAVLAVLVLAYFYFRKKRANRAANQQWESESYEKQESLAGSRVTRQSTVGSIASTVLTRASNVIQIAYIPGVTNRSPPDTPGLLVPPVPPLPTANGSTYGQDQHFFMPGDIRDSVWSQMTEDDRKSMSPSLARSSVATTLYRHDAIVSPVPAQQALRAKAAVVSVKSGCITPSESPPSSTPVVPPITASQIDKANAVGAKMEKKNDKAANERKFAGSIVARSMVARPVNLTKSPLSPRSPRSPRSKTSTISETDESSNPMITVSQASSVRNEPARIAELPGDLSTAIPNPSRVAELPGDHPNKRQSNQSVAVTVIEDSPSIKQSPFDDSHASPDQPKSPTTKPDQSEKSTPDENNSSQSSNQLQEPHSKPDSENSLQRSMSPFDDKNEVKP
ncbi:hypothetical protein RJZ56_007375 [Blastomyces dermatitidis]|uniref:Membrane anchor Opy2 N-terminal domain-containing protein n=1 Tax=Ajellomyces dermatitidis (strain ATCC 18188 / CBS 674.68) TaxID=653446 RepID=F2TAZ7_AJEDA|nr:hypothetical protein BDDG_03351 [Blastomyces dermatitidis ATCC 18188]